MDKVEATYLLFGIGINPNDVHLGHPFCGLFVYEISVVVVSFCLWDAAVVIVGVATGDLDCAAEFVGPWLIFDVEGTKSGSAEGAIYVVPHAYKFLSVRFVEDDVKEP